MGRGVRGCLGSVAEGGVTEQASHPPCLSFQLSVLPPAVSKRPWSLVGSGKHGAGSWGAGRVAPWLRLPALLPLSPAGGSTILYNCSTCEGAEATCWPRKRCFPGSHDLWEARILLVCFFVTVLLLGAVSLQLE